MENTDWAADTLLNHWGLQHRVDINTITDDELRPIVSAMAGEPVTEWAITNEREQKGKKGFYGYKPVFTFSWKTASGREGTTVTCVKQGNVEAVHYQNLARLGVPVCTLFGAMARPENEPNQQEILFMEYLEPVGLDENNPEHLHRFLAIKAHLHAAHPSEEYRDYLLASKKVRPEDSETAEAFAERIGKIWGEISACAGRGELGAEFDALYREFPDAPAHMAHRAHRTHPKVAAMPLCLTCMELGPGWRRNTNEMVCFDLHSTSLSPQFWDLTHIFGTPPGVHDGWQTTWPDRESLALFYTREWERISGSPLSTAHLFAQTRLLWTKHALNQGWWLKRALAGEDGCRDDMLSVAHYFLRPETRNE